jgi:hypothetical protein
MLFTGDEERHDLVLMGILADEFAALHSMNR